MKTIIAGSRHFRDYIFLDLEMQHVPWIITEYVSGGQVSVDRKTGEKYGADYLGEKYAKKKGFTPTVFRADWYPNGRRGGLDRSAGPKRNEEMAQYADALIAFHMGGDGTADMIRHAKRYNLLTHIIRL